MILAAELAPVRGILARFFSRQHGESTNCLQHTGSTTSGGERAVAMCSLIGTCKLSGIDPEAYLRHVLTHIADHPINRELFVDRRSGARAPGVADITGGCRLRRSGRSVSRVTAGSIPC
jgi:hypothetical protein